MLGDDFSMGSFGGWRWFASAVDGVPDGAFRSAGGGGEAFLSRPGGGLWGGAGDVGGPRLSDSPGQAREWTHRGFVFPSNGRRFSGDDAASDPDRSRGGGAGAKPGFCDGHSFGGDGRADSWRRDFRASFIGRMVL